MIWIIAVVGLLILSVAIRFVFQESRRIQVLDRRLTGVRTWALAAYGEPEQRARRNASNRPLYLILVGALNIASILIPVGAAERAKLRQLLTKAGFRQPDALSVFMAIKLVVTVTAGCLAGFWAAQSESLGDYTALIVLIGLIGAVVGGMLPEMGLRRLASRRLANMAAALPDALDLITLCLESGLTFERTLTRVAQELTPLAPDLARELSQVETELRIGADRKTALNDLYTRTEVDGLRDLATTVVQGERYGTPLAQSMQNIAGSERTQRAARIAAQVERLPVLMSLPMLLLVMPGTVMLVAGPGIMLTLEALRGIVG